MDPSVAVDEVQNLIRAVQVPAVQKPALQSICMVNGLPKTGNKSDLQNRIITRIRETAPNPPAFHEVRASIYTHAKPRGSPSNLSTPQPQSYHTPAASPISVAPFGVMASSHGCGLGHPNKPQSNYAAQQFHFKPSPFYEIKHRIGEVKTLGVMAQHRNSVSIPLKSQDKCLVDLKVGEDPSMRVMVLCAGGNEGLQDIAFPYQSELKVNSGDVKANLRGLKNRPATTRPVDITHLLRLRPVTYQNMVEFTYALTQKKFYFGLYLCKTRSVTDLVNQIRHGKRITKSQVLYEMDKKARDPDIEAMSQIVDLKCPISFTRPSLPCRGLACSHLTCFDASAYLQLQDQAPQWTCPVCEKSTPFEWLAVDEYMQDILDKTSTSLEQITIDPKGRWEVASSHPKQTTPDRRLSHVLDADDLVVAEVSFGQGHAIVTPSRAAATLGTPRTTMSRESSLPYAAGTKRCADVIDLTISDEDESLPRPPPKRTHLSTNSNDWGSVTDC